MSFLTYNGIQMSLVQTRRYLQEPIMLAQDTAGSRHILTVLATIHLRHPRPPCGRRGGRLGGGAVDRRT